jgi:hypothetical protein
MATSKKQQGAAPAAEGAQAGQQPMVPPGGWPRDEFTGQPGRFVRDPVTGVRRPADPPVAEQAATE